MIFVLAVISIFILFYFFNILFCYFCQILCVVSILHNVSSTEYWFFRCFIFFSTIDGSFLLLGFLLLVLIFLTLVQFWKFSSLVSSVFVCLCFGCFYFCGFSLSAPLFVDFNFLDGFSLNAILRNPVIMVHPPFLYLSFLAVFYFFLLLNASVTYRTLDIYYIFGFFFYLGIFLLLFVSICLGGFWAYFVLGWGGWWFWDPVELYAALFCGFIICRLHFLKFLMSYRVGYLWLLQEFWYIIILGFYLLVGLFYLRAGLISSIHNFVLDFSSSWFFFFLSNCFFFLIFVTIYFFYFRGFFKIVFLWSTFFTFFVQYILFNYFILNIISCFFFNSVLFQEFFLFINVGSFFTCFVFFFFMWILLKGKYSPFLLSYYVFSLFFFVESLVTPLFFLIWLGIGFFFLLYLFFNEGHSYISGMHLLFIMVTILVLLNKFFSFMLILPINLGESFYLFKHLLFFSTMTFSYSLTHLSSCLLIIDVLISSSLEVSTYIYMSSLYSFFSGLVSSENLVFSFLFYDLQLVILNHFTANISTICFDCYLCKSAFSLVQGLLWFFCLFLVVYIISFYLYLWNWLIPRQ